jgi:DNA repair exonuclease SbcCD ATPase subunit
VRVKVRPFSDTGVKQILTDAETYRSTIQKVQEELKQVRLAYDEMKKQLHEQEQSYKTQLKALSQQRDAVASDYDRLSAEKDELQKQYTSLQDEVQRLRQLQEEVRQIQLAYTATKKQLDEQEQLHQRQLDDFKQQIIDIGQARIKEITNLMQQHEAILNDLSRIREEKDELQKQYNLLRDAVQRLRQALDHEERQIESFKDAFACLNEAVRDLYGTWVKYIPETHSLNTPYQHLIDIWSQTVAAYHQSDEAEVIVQIYRLGKAFDDMISVWKSFWYSAETFVVLKLFNAAHDAWKKAYANLPYKQMGRTATESDKVKLTSEVSEFQANNEQLSGELATARASNSKVERQIQELHNQVKQQERWQQANRRKLEQFDWLEQQAQRAAALEAELHAAQHRIRQLEAARRQLLGELGQRDTDFDNTSVSGSRPQHEELVRQFRQLRDDGIEPAVRAIFNYMSRQDPSLKSPGQRREKLAFIKASISTRILVEVEVGESSDVQTSSDRVVVEQILHRLELPAQAQELDEIRGLLVPLVAEGLQLAQQVEAAHPRGILWIEKVGEPFDSQRHETVAGSSESGPVSFTIFPGYDVGNRILVPAVVWTSKIRN